MWTCAKKPSDFNIHRHRSWRSWPSMNSWSWYPPPKFAPWKMMVERKEDDAAPASYWVKRSLFRGELFIKGGKKCFSCPSGISIPSSLSKQDIHLSLSLSLSLISPEKKPQLCSVRLQIDKTRLLSNSAQKTCGKLLSIDGPLKNMYRRHGNKVNPFLFSRFFLHLEQQHEPGKRS